MNNENAYPLEIAGLIDAKEKCPYYDGFQWADPSEEHLIYLMRYVYEHQEAAIEKGKKASYDVLNNWTWRNSARQIQQRLEAITK